MKKLYEMERNRHVGVFVVAESLEEAYKKRKAPGSFEEKGVFIVEWKKLKYQYNGVTDLKLIKAIKKQYPKIAEELKK